MPCYDERNEPDHVRDEAFREFRHNSPVADMLCSVLRTMTPFQISQLRADVREWWAEHQRRDAETSNGTR